MSAKAEEKPGKKRNRRAVAEESDSPFSGQIDERSRTAVRAYLASVYALVPVVGAILGPVALVLAILAWREGRNDSEFKSWNLVRAAIILGIPNTLTNWAGLTLMYLGLQ